MGKTKKTSKSKINKTSSSRTKKQFTKKQNITKSKDISTLYDFPKINECLKVIDVIYWINLDRSKDRRENSENNLKNINNKNIRISASDGVLDSDENIYGKFTNVNKSEINKNITRKEYACLLSHLEAIRQFANSDHEIALILEDDFTFEFSKYWNKPISEIINGAPCNWDIISLGFSLGRLIMFPSLYVNNKGDDYRIYSLLSYVISKKLLRN